MNSIIRRAAQRPQNSFPSWVVAGLAVSLALLCPPAEAKLYKWVDDNGNVTYSQQKPPDRKAQTLELKGVESPDPEAAEKLEQLKDREQSRRKDREFAKEQTDAAKAREARLKQNCEIARQNVRILKDSPRVQDKDESGEAYFLDDAQRKSRLQQAEQQVKDYC